MPARAARDRPEPRDDVIHLAIRLALLAGLLYWSFVLIEPFVWIIVWSMILTVAMYPAYDWMSRKLGHQPALAAVLITLLSLGIILAPAIWFGMGLADGVRMISDELASDSLSLLPPPPEAIKTWPLVGGQIYDLWQLASTNIGGAFATLRPYLKPMAKPVLEMATGAGGGIVKFLLALLLMGFLFGPGPRLMAGVRSVLSHVVPERTDEFLAMAGATVRAVSQGVLGVAVIQALLAGIGFWIAGVPGGSVLTFAVLFLSIIQFGAQVVLIGAAIWVWTAMGTMPALLLTIYFVVVGLLDNVLKPIMMGASLNTPMLVILIGVLGGTIAHGLVGLFVGPVVLAVAWQLLLAWMRSEEEDLPVAAPATKAEAVTEPLRAGE
jgi:predicted PurR-regulated permease PerM